MLGKGGSSSGGLIITHTQTRPDSTRHSMGPSSSGRTPSTVLYSSPALSVPAFGKGEFTQRRSAPAVPLPGLCNFLIVKLSVHT